MSQPTYYADGTANNQADTEQRIWTKILGAIQNALGGNAIASNNPSPGDTTWRLQQKFIQAKNNQSGPIK